MSFWICRLLRASFTRSREKHNSRSWLKSRQREIEARKWRHTDTPRLVVWGSTRVSGGGRLALSKWIRRRLTLTVTVIDSLTAVDWSLILSLFTNFLCILTFWSVSRQMRNICKLSDNHQSFEGIKLTPFSSHIFVKISKKLKRGDEFFNSLSLFFDCKYW